MLRAVLAVTLTAAGLCAAPTANAGCDYDSRTVTCEVRHRPDGSYAICTLHMKLVGGADADCTRVCPPLEGSAEVRPYVEGRPC